MPSQAALQRHKFLKIFGTRLLNADYWHSNRHSCAVAIAAGLFAAWFPLPMHSFIAIGIALLLRGYLPLAITMVWVSNPLTLAPMMYGAYHVGARLLNLPTQELKHLFDHDFYSLASPLLVGAFTLALLSALLGWLLTHLYWRCKISRAWQARKQR
ncbi:hypothetical protein CBP12_01700 [Oceanisphaera avium]|uniref:DUF2062 domain-containing protein n=2 Tax=Oceanisphaera avium TaxID=1903694 RepID=A0A1Y0D1H9_9GAMM|nr:hypothetical protein CBP12_01700 [Oceanisphaera avium]